MRFILAILFTSCLLLVSTGLHLRVNHRDDQNIIQADAPISAWEIAGAVPGNLTVNGNELSFILPNVTEESRDPTPCNAYWNDGSAGVTSGEHYWEVSFHTLMDQNAAVGLTNRAIFKSGSVPFGLLFDGHLTTGDGKLLSRTPFGPSPAPEAVIGILASFTSHKSSTNEPSTDRLQISFFWDSHPLGVAYDVPSSVLLILHFS